MGRCPLFVFQSTRQPNLSSLRDHQRQQIRAIAERVARSHGVELFDVQLRRESLGWVVRIIIDRPGGDATRPEDGISLKDCQRVSEDMGAMLDVDDVVDCAYTLEVSSPGLDRPLRDAAEYRRFVGRLAKIVVSEAVDGQRFLAGRIQHVTDAEVVLDTGKRTHRIPLHVITRGRLEVEFEKSS